MAHAATTWAVFLYVQAITLCLNHNPSLTLASPWALGEQTPKYFLVLEQLDPQDMAQAATVWSVFFYVWAIALVTTNPAQTLTRQP